jgi:hypothetical protein
MFNGSRLLRFSRRHFMPAVTIPFSRCQNGPESIHLDLGRVVQGLDLRHQHVALLGYLVTLFSDLVAVP